MRRANTLALLAGLCFALAGGTATAQTVSFGPFYVPDGRPELVVLDGPIARGDGQIFWNALQFYLRTSKRWCCRARAVSSRMRW